MKVHYLPVFLFSLGWVSCATGPGDFREAPASRAHAVVKPGRVVKMILPFEASDTAIVSIDGKSPSYFRMDSTFRIEPGRRTLVLSHYGTGETGTGEILLDAVEGKTYVVKSDAIGMNIRFWIEDAAGRMLVKKEVPLE